LQPVGRAPGLRPTPRRIPAGQRLLDHRPPASFASGLRHTGKWRSGSKRSKDWQQAIWWVERGLTLYGKHAARAESVDDLRKRLGAYRAKMSAPTKPSRKAQSKPQAAPADQTIEVLVCETCGASFDRVVIRGRKPKNCPACRRTERTAGAVAS
jgi:hypothetical protein